MALLDHDDMLAEHALFWVAEAINRHPDAGLIYSDEDKIDESGRRFDPYFKCDWNYDLFLSQNTICHLSVYKAELMRKIGGLLVMGGMSMCVRAQGRLMAQPEFPKQK